MSQITRIGRRYEIIEKLGEGGMGAVYKARDRLTRDIVALKQVLVKSTELQFGSKPSEDDDDSLRLALAKEFQTLAGLRHPHIVSVLDYGFDEQRRPYFTMDYLEQPQTLVDYAVDLPQTIQVALLVQMLEALFYLHQRGVLHRDIKPDNILVTQDGIVKVMDFGLAVTSKRQSQDSQTDRLAGTIHYMAPELFQGSKASVASDLYAVGIIAYEILCGKYPYKADNVGELLMQIINNRPIIESLETDLNIWLNDLFEKKPSQRPPSAYDTLKQLCNATNIPIPPQSVAVRESYLQAATFVGRKTEYQQLLTALAQTQNGTNQFFLISGESGVGKTRLVEELRTQSLVNGFFVVRGQGVAEGDLPFQLWREPLRRLLLQVDVDNFQLGVLKDILPDINPLLEREIASPPTLVGRAYRKRLVLAIVEVFRYLEQPTLLILDDLQWAGESLLPLRQMLQVSDQLPQLMVLGTYRDDEYPGLPDEVPGMEILHLARLESDSIAKLCQFMLGERVLASELVAQVERESEGNTYFLVEIMRSIAQETTHLQTVDLDNLPQGILTEGMKSLFDQRLAQLPPKYLLVLQTAAVSGRRVDEKLLGYSNKIAIPEF